MLWALLFSLILNNDPAFIIPKLEKEVKQNILDKERKDEILDIRKESKKNRKQYRKDRKKTFKKFDKLNTSRETTAEEFNELLQIKKIQRNELQEKDTERILRVKNLITKDEWALMLPDINKHLNKHEKQKRKELKVLAKQHEKIVKQIVRVIEEPERQNQIITVTDTIYSSTVNYVKTYYKFIENINSVIYDYNFSEEELHKVVSEVNAANDAVLDASIAGHFSIKELTTPQEWKKIVKEIIKL